MSEHRYLHSNTKDEVELNRLDYWRESMTPPQPVILKVLGFLRARIALRSALGQSQLRSSSEGVWGPLRGWWSLTLI